MRLAAVALVAASTLAAGPAAAQFLPVRIESRPRLPDGSVLVDDVVAAVVIEGDERPPIFVLGREAELEIRYEWAIAGDREAFRRVVDLASARALIQRVMGERLLEREATRATDPPPTSGEIEEERSRLVERLAPMGGVEPLVRTVRVSSADFDLFVRRRWIVARFLERHYLRLVEPTQREIRTAYENEEIEPFRARGTPPGRARQEITAALTERNIPVAILSYLRSIGSRAQIRLWTSEANGRP